MTTKEYNKIKEGDYIEHKHFGLCYVDERLLAMTDKSPSLFGLAIRPVNSKGINHLMHNSGVPYNRVLEDKCRNIKAKVEITEAPPIVLKVADEVFEIHKWKNPGLFVEDKGYDTEAIHTCQTYEEAAQYIKNTA